MKRFAVLTTVLIGSLSSLAHAGWQGAEWGMSASEVSARVQVKVIPLPPAQQVAKAVPGSFAKFTGAFSAGEFEFDVILQFNNQDKLNAARLKLADFAQCEGLRGSLTSRYGTPNQVRRDRSETTVSWIDAPNSNTVDLHVTPGIRSCTVIYSPLDVAAGKRL